jgi:hypothetical protein
MQNVSVSKKRKFAEFNKNTEIKGKKGEFGESYHPGSKISKLDSKRRKVVDNFKENKEPFQIIDSNTNTLLRKAASSEERKKTEKKEQVPPKKFNLPKT